jgi:hypothetical protein
MFVESDLQNSAGMRCETRWNAESVMRKVHGASRMTDFRTPNAAHVITLLYLIGTDELTASVGGWGSAA